MSNAANQEQTVVGQYDQTVAVVKESAANLAAMSFREAALFWFRFGLGVIPIKPEKKVPDVSWDPWLRELSALHIHAYWKHHSDREVGFIVGDRAIVFDADSPTAIAALYALEQKFDMTSALIVRTTKGEHHYFRRAAGMCATSDAHSTKLYPERIDVKTGRALVVLPPSTGKVIVRCDVDCAFSLNEASQEFVDAVATHNGRSPERMRKMMSAVRKMEVRIRPGAAFIEALLRHVEADCGYDDWLRVLMVIFYETDGSTEGLDLADAWSSGGGDKYKGRREIEAKWASFDLDREPHPTIGTLIKMAQGRGADIAAIRRALDTFEEVETLVIYPDGQAGSPQPPEATHTVTA